MLEMINKCQMLFLVLLVSFAQVHGQCSMTKRNIEQSNGVFTYNDAAGLHLQRTATVGAGVTLTMRCDGNEMHQTTCVGNRFNPPLPLTCRNPPPAPRVRSVQNREPSCPADMYEVGHIFDNQFMPLYQACYDGGVRGAVRSHFSDVILFPKSIYPARPDVRFTTDELITPAQEASFLTRNIYSAFRRIYGPNQNYIRNNRDLVINRGHLTASSDFLFGDQSTGTFKYLNVVPQFKTINDGNWRTIEMWVNNIVPANSMLRVRTGALEVLYLPDSTPARTMRPAFLHGTNQNPVPMWMYKIVRNENHQPLYVFITDNNSIPHPRPPPPNVCQVPIDCPIALPNDPTQGYTYCCDPARFNV